MRINNMNTDNITNRGYQVPDIGKFSSIQRIMTANDRPEKDVNNRLRKAKATFGRLKWAGKYPDIWHTNIETYKA